jgi:hypothetical protein
MLKVADDVFVERAYEHLYLVDCRWDEDIVFTHAVVNLCTKVRNIAKFMS